MSTSRGESLRNSSRTRSIALATSDSPGRLLQEHRFRARGVDFEALVRDPVEFYIRQKLETQVVENGQQKPEPLFPTPGPLAGLDQDAVANPSAQLK